MSRHLARWVGCGPQFTIFLDTRSWLGPLPIVLGNQSSTTHLLVRYFISDEYTHNEGYRSNHVPILPFILQVCGQQWVYQTDNELKKES